MADKAQRQLPKQLEKYKWKKGQSGNPGGMRKGRISVMTLMKRLLRENPAGAEKIALSILEQAANGNERSQQLVLERIDGKMPDHVVTANEIKGWRINFIDGEEDDGDGTRSGHEGASDTEEISSE